MRPRPVLGALHLPGRCLFRAALASFAEEVATLGYPALTLRPNLLAQIRSGHTHKLGLVVTTRESGGTGARLPLTVAV